MTGNSENKEVRFDKYCSKCAHWENGTEVQYCDDCLEVPLRRGTEVPIKWEKKQ